MLLKRAVKVFGVSQLLLVILCGLMEIVNLPDSLEVRMDSSALVGVQVGYHDKTGKIVYDRERPFSALGEIGVTRVVLSTSYGLSEMAWGFKNGPCEITLNSVVLKKWLVIPFEIPLSTLTTVYHPTEGMSVSVRHDGKTEIKLHGDGGYFVLDKARSIPLRLHMNSEFLALFVGVELLLFLMSLIVSKARLQDEKVSFARFAWQAILVSALAAFFFCLALPLQSYMVNRESWPFTCGELLEECFVAFSLCFVLLFAIFWLLKPCFARLSLAFAWGVVLCSYLETGIFSLGLPSLNGDIGFFVMNQLRGRLDLLALASIMVIVVLSYKWLREYIHYMAIGLFVMVLASFLDVRVEEKIDNGDAIVDDFCSSEAVTESAFYSAEGNNLLFILDTMTTEVVTDILKEDREMADVLSGFIAYTNNIGMHQMTSVGIPGIMHGKYCDISSNIRAYESSALSHKSFIESYVTSQTPTFFMLSLTRPYNWSSEQAMSSANKQDAEPSSAETPLMMRRLSGLQAWNMMEVIRFRLTPFMFKWQVFLMTIKDWPMYEKGAVEFSLFPKLAALPERSGVEQTLHVYHTAGAHAPFFTDRFGRKLSSPGQGYAGYREKAYFVLKSLTNLFRELQARGIYDNSFIVVTSDHGGDYTQKDKRMCNGVEFPRAVPYPMLMVKPRGNKTPLAFSNVPTSHAKLSTLMSSSRTRSLAEQEVTSILHEENRFFRYFVSHEMIHYDWKFSPDGSMTCEMIKE